VAEETKVIVQREETQAAQKAKETQAIADDAQRDLNEALPALVDIDIYICNIIGHITFLPVILLHFSKFLLSQWLSCTYIFFLIVFC